MNDIPTTAREYLRQACPEHKGQDPGRADRRGQGTFGGAPVTQKYDLESFRRDDEWQMLAEAIILQAVDDYRKLVRRQKKHPDNLGLQREIHKIERFFRSDWFGMLCDLDGRKLLMDLKAEVHT